MADGAINVPRPQSVPIGSAHGRLDDNVRRQVAQPRRITELDDVGVQIGGLPPVDLDTIHYDAASGGMLFGAPGGGAIQGDRLAAENTSGTSSSGSINTTIPLADFLDEDVGTSITQDASFNFMTLVNAGFYSIDACVQFDELSATPIGGVRVGYLNLSAGVVAPPRVAVTPVQSSIEHFTRIPLHMTAHFAAGTTVTLMALHDGATLTVTGFMNILRLA